MRTISFPDWETQLENAAIPYGEKQSFAITIRWYLSYCKRQQYFVDFSSARSFINKAAESKPQSSQWVIERWKESIRWLFKNAPKEIQKAPTSSKPKVKTMRLGESAPEWRLRMFTTLRRRHLSYRTETTYIGWVLRFARFIGHHDLEKLKANSINHFMDHLARDLKVSAGTQRQALNALVFLYREVYKQNLGDFAEYKKAYSKKRVPVILSHEELQIVFDSLKMPYSLMAQLQYGAGLRVSELMSLRVKDLDFDHCLLTIRGGKGDKDRVAQLPPILHVALRKQIECSKQFYEEDRKNGVAGVWLPEALARKYPKAGQSWPWQWLWPMNHLSKDPREPDMERRHHTLERVYQRALHRGVSQAEITKRVTSHVLRHSYATHLLEQGENIRAVQELLGHKNLETTRLYLHLSTKSDARHIKSPLQRLKLQ